VSSAAETRGLVELICGAPDKKMAMLLRDLRLGERRDLLRQVLEHAVPHSREDVVIVFASASGLVLPGGGVQNLPTGESCAQL